MKKYSDKLHSDYGEKIIDDYTGEYVPEVPKTNVARIMANLIKWAEDRRGGKFPNPKKQYSALAMARKAKITPTRLKNRWCEMDTEEYWIKRGFDWMDVVNSFNRKP